MSSITSVKLTKEQQEFLNSLEEEFKDRYTEKDEEFKAALNEVLPLPPLVENVREFRQQHGRYTNDRNDHYRNYYHYYNNDDGRYSHSSRYVYRNQNHIQSMYRPYLNN